jgi:hypothetical protein
VAGHVPAIDVLVVCEANDMDAGAGKFNAACASLAAGAGMTPEMSRPRLI